MFYRRLVGHLTVTSRFVADFEDTLTKSMTIIKKIAKTQHVQMAKEERRRFEQKRTHMRKK